MMILNLGTESANLDKEHEYRQDAQTKIVFIFRFAPKNDPGRFRG